MAGDDGAAVQLVHLHRLELEGQQALPGVPLDEKHTAVHLFPAHGHAEHLTEALGAGDVAVALFAPLGPELLYLMVQLRLAGLRLQSKAPAHHVADEGPHYPIEHI